MLESEFIGQIVLESPALKNGLAAVADTVERIDDIFDRMVLGLPPGYLANHEHALEVLYMAARHDQFIHDRLTRNTDEPTPARRNSLRQTFEQLPNHWQTDPEMQAYATALAGGDDIGFAEPSTAKTRIPNLAHQGVIFILSVLNK